MSKKKFCSNIKTEKYPKTAVFNNFQGQISQEPRVMSYINLEISLKKDYTSKINEWIEKI